LEVEEGTASADEVTKAKEVIAGAKAAVAEALS